MKQVRKVLAIVLTLVLTISIIPISNVSAANKVKLNKKKATVYVGKNVILKLKNNNGNVKWSSSNKKVATVSSKGKVKGKRAGKATITAKVGSKKYKCKITVKDIINVKLPKTPFKVSSYEDGILVATYKITNISYSTNIIIFTCLTLLLLINILTFYLQQDILKKNVVIVI